MLKKSIMILLRNPVLQHGVFWVVSFYILLNVFSSSSTFQKIDFIYTGIFTGTLFIAVAMNLYVAIPTLLRNGKYLLYALSFLVLLFGFSWMNQMVFDRFIDLVLPEYFFISYYDFGDVLTFFCVFLMVTTLLQLSKEWFELNTTRQKMILLEREKIDAELKALSNQVNPHFLFNSLNVLYSLAVQQKKEAPEAILKLSDILRYVIYDSAHNTTSIDAEVTLIQNYIDLQRFRVGEHAKIEFSVHAEDQNRIVAPMLLLPLVENGFKHGIKGDIKHTFLNIKLSVEGEDLTFIVENNKGVDVSEDKGQSHGVGLENIKNRLQLLYSGNHEFHVDNTEHAFRVELIIKKLQNQA